MDSNNHQTAGNPGTGNLTSGAADAGGVIIRAVEHGRP